MSIIRKYLSADGLIEIVRHCWRREKFAELNSEYSWQDCVMSGLAIFGFKYPSLLQFEKDKVKPMIRRNLRTLYHVEKVPSDTCLRERLDKISAQQFSWVTKLKLTEENMFKVMRAARARWKIENETFNTLKNQGYHFEHNYGHGYENLCSVMTMLMLLAFLIDQVQQLCCKAYQKAIIVRGTFSNLFHFVQSLLDLFVWESFQQLWLFIGNPNEHPPPLETVWSN